MGSAQWRRIAGVFLIVGGLVEAAALGVGTLISPPATTPLGVGLLSAYAVGEVCTGCGLMAASVSLAGRGRLALMVAGVLALITSVVNAAQDATGAPLGPSLAAGVLFFASFVTAAARLWSNPGLHLAVRWALAIPAVFFILQVVFFSNPPLSPPGSVVLPWIGTAVAGVFLLESLRRPHQGALRPV